MINNKALAVFENFKIRRIYGEKAEIWYFSVVDIVAALIQQPEHQTARKYWNKLKERLKKEGSQSVTNCHQLKLPAVAWQSESTLWWRTMSNMLAAGLMDAILLTLVVVPTVYALVENSKPCLAALPARIEARYWAPFKGRFRE